MSAASDLDLIFVYDAPAGVEFSDGERKLPLIVYYARFAQRLIAALTVPTPAGELYEVDMRLRPSGNKGPAAVSLESFSRYHERESWTWERMALTRARVVSGAAELSSKVDAVIARTLADRRTQAMIKTDARAMRDKLASQFPGHNPWDLKFAPGGMVDIEFVAQAMQLGNAGLRHANTIAAIEALAAANLLGKSDAEILAEAATLEQALSQVLRIATEGAFQPDTATPGLRGLLTRAGGSESFEHLERRLSQLQAQVRAVFEKSMRP